MDGDACLVVGSGSSGQQCGFHTLKLLKMSLLKVRPDSSWPEKMEIYLFFNSSQQTCVQFLPPLEWIQAHISHSLIKHFNRYDDGHLIRGEHGSYSSEHKRIKICWTNKRERGRVTKAPKPQTAILCSVSMALSWLLFPVVKTISCRSHTLPRAQVYTSSN